MRICSKCNKEVHYGELYCTRCGFSLIKNKYGQRVEIGGASSKVVLPQNAERINNDNKERKNWNFNFKNNLGNNETYKKNSTAAAMIFIVFFISTFIPIILSIFTNVKTTTTTNIISGAVYDDAMREVKLLLDDNLNVRTYYDDNGKISVKEISEITSIEEANLVNAWCNYLSVYSTESDAVSCAITAHNDLGDNNLTLAYLNQLYIDINNDYYDDPDYNTLVKISDTLNDMYYLSIDSYDTYSNYLDKYNNLNDELNNYIDELS